MIEQNEHDTPMHKWERIEAQLERVWEELKESNATNLVLQRSQMDLCQERDQLKAELVARTIERDALHGTVMKLILDAEKWRSAWTKEQHE